MITVSKSGLERLGDDVRRFGDKANLAAQLSINDTVKWARTRLKVGMQQQVNLTESAFGKKHFAITQFARRDNLQAVLSAPTTPTINWAKDVNGVRYVKVLIVGSSETRAAERLASELAAFVDVDPAPTLVIDDVGAVLIDEATSPLVISSPVRLRGAGPHAVQLIAPAGAIASGNYILDINCLAANNVEHIIIEGLTVRSLDSVPNGIRVKNAGYTAFTDVRVFGVANGMDFDGTRCFSNTFDRFISYGVTNASVRFLSTFAGGGQFIFRASTFVGAYGVQVPVGALTENVVFLGCNWEGCTIRAVQANGTTQGWTFISARGEAGTGHGFEFAPSAAHECTGLVFHGMSYYNGTVAARPITLGTAAGTGGRVRGFSVTGCRVGYAGQDYFCVLNAEVQSGVIAGNHFSETTTAAISAPRAGVAVFGNENGAGRLPEYNGLNLVEQGTFTATATGMTTSPTGTCKYAVNDGAVTLDIPNITGTSNATTFTLTGAPVAVRPAVDKDVLCRVQDNSGAVGLGLLRMKTTGVIELYVSAAGNSFTAAGTKSVSAMSITYTLN